MKSDKFNDKYEAVGLLLGLLFTFSITNYLNYLSNQLNKPLLGEFSMIFFIVGLPVFGLLGFFCGSYYKKRFKE